MPCFRSLLEYYRFEKARHHLTQEELRKRWGLKSQSHVHALIYGKCRPKPELARVISKDTGIDILDVLGVKKNQQQADNSQDNRIRTGSQTASTHPAPTKIFRGDSND